ncbi:energy-coupling factor ABC transporter ATP-binding protein [Neomoorella mulderi]|uniref:Energy-coupling factor transporter ATP-binding protein EcfA2 n=1 Tax=Moorella mulderi DSM 14980 TaxID=1122241 RepID=A0A151AT09_9FIRM|nr:ABC transporter ATP-binding protein [Moorella mulderi]KYH30794.1 energy-coupling factor transporter ATP-binding protein EcfA2 [Moorella mulderi DSM 14980]
MKAALTFNNVSYRYPDSQEMALKGINLTVTEGEFVGIIGPNAAGKSTLCRAANGLIPHSFSGDLEGDIYVNGINTKEKKPAQLAEYVGLVFADPEAQLSQMTVWEEVAFGPANLGIPREEIFKRVDLMLGLLKIEKMRDRSPFNLSGGEQQKVAIASVLAMEPRILVLDEPTSNLDPRGTAEVFAAVKELNKKQNITVIMVEHEVELLAEHADRIIFMDHGQILLDGPPGEVFRQVELIQKTGMNIPQVTEVAQILDKEYGVWGNKPYPVTIEELYACLRNN